MLILVIYNYLPVSFCTQQAFLKNLPFINNVSSILQKYSISIDGANF